MTRASIAGWVLDAARHVGWPDVACALAIGIFPLLFGPHGGGLFVFIQDVREVDPLLDPSKDFLHDVFVDIASIGIPLVFAVKVANRSIADGVPRWLAYGAALAFASVVHHLCLPAPSERLDGGKRFPAEVAWNYMEIFLQGGIGLVSYARWRAAKESMRLIQANETRRAHAAQRLQSARLLALQARVDPQLLFDSLRGVNVLQRNEPAAAEALLSDLIAMLRAMLPGETALTSTVEREFALIDAWLRVSGAVANERAEVALCPAVEVASCRLAPLLALPLLRAALDVPGARAVPWRLDAVAAGGRLLVTLAGAPGAETPAAEVLARADLAALRERLASLHGDTAKLWFKQPAMATLDVPLAIDDGDVAGDEGEGTEAAPAGAAIAQDAAA